MDMSVRKVSCLQEIGAHLLGPSQNQEHFPRHIVELNKRVLFWVALVCYTK